MSRGSGVSKLGLILVTIAEAAAERRFYSDGGLSGIK